MDGLKKGSNNEVGRGCAGSVEVEGLLVEVFAERDVVADGAADEDGSKVLVGEGWVLGAKEGDEALELGVLAVGVPCGAGDDDVVDGLLGGVAAAGACAAPVSVDLTCRC